jgi:hypothetical protein
MEETIDSGNGIAANQIPQTLPNSTATLVLGILSIVLCFPGFIFGIIGMVLHKKDKELYLSNTQVYEASYKTARAGYVCSIIGTCLSAFVVLFYVIYFIFIFSIIDQAGGFK